MRSIYSPSRSYPAGLLLVFIASLAACGTDAERRYAGWSTSMIDVDSSGYRLRYQNPPWKPRKDDPLVTGSRSDAPIGGTNRPIVPDSAVVLEVDKQSAAASPGVITYPKYRLEAALVRCDASELEPEQSCAQLLAGLDHEARSEEGKFDVFGSEPRQSQNDFEQVYYELTGQVEETRRYRRIMFFETEEPTLTAWLFIEGNPELGEREITQMVRAFEVVTPEAAR